MFKSFAAAVSMILLCVGSVRALDAPGVVKKVDVAGGIIVVFANGQDRTITVASDAKFLDTAGKPLADGLAAKELKAGAEVTITVEPNGGRPILRAVRLGGTPTQQMRGGRESVGLKPLTEMTANDRYKGEDGGLYGGGKNEPPPALAAAAKKVTAEIKPLDADGKPDAGGIVGLISISMSNATQEFSYFKQIADRDAAKSRSVVIVDCAQGGQAMAEWVSPNAGPWAEADKRLAAAKVSPNQVQVVWIKLANKGPRGELAEHGKKLERDTLAVLHNAKERFPNLRIAYLGSRIYGGYSDGALNPEPYAYEGAFAVRWLIQDQMKGDANLNYDAARGPVKSPLLLWGPYFWADGVKPRASDSLVWKREDLGPDGTHPSQSGREKVAKMLLEFFKTDADAKTWFVKR